MAAVAWTPRAYADFKPICAYHARPTLSSPMPDDRRYSEAEIAAIFDRAAHAQEQASRGATHGGLTLAELHEVGRAAGIDPAFVDRAAAAVRTEGPTPRATKVLGQTVSVARVTALPGPFSDADWAALVADLRATFEAEGTVRVDDAGRRWSNGNLRVHVEPAADGHRLRLQTRNAQVQGQLQAGLMGIAATLGLALLEVTTGASDLPTLFGIWGLVGMVALALLGAALYRLPAWREERDAQMEAVAGRALDRAMRSAPEAGVPTPTDEPLLDLDALPDALTEDARDGSPHVQREAS